MGLEQVAKQIFMGTAPLSIVLQFLISVLHTLFLIYLVVLITKRFTYVRSHLWVMIETLVACGLCFAVYRLYVWLDLRHLAWFILLALFSGLVESVVWHVDGGWVLDDGRRVMGGRSMVDVDAEKKSLFQTDCRLVRRAAMWTLSAMWLTWRAL